MIFRLPRFSLRRIGSTLAISGVLAGCAATPYRLPSVPPGSVVEVNQTLEVPYGSARVFMQNGRVIARGDIDYWAVYCSLQTRPVRESGEAQMKVEPGKFEVYEVRLFNDRNRVGRVYTAARGSRFDWPAFIIHQAEMRLRAADQPGVRALICAKNGDLVQRFERAAYYPSLAEIWAAVGGLIDIATR